MEYKIKQKSYAFYYHYNKPLSRASGSPKLSIHYRKQCHIVDFIECNVPTKSKNNVKQPHVVITGKGILRIENGIGIIE